MRRAFYLLAFSGFALLTLGCGDSGNTVIEPAEDGSYEQEMNEMQSQFEGTGGGDAGTKSPGN